MRFKQTIIVAVALLVSTATFAKIPRLLQRGGADEPACKAWVDATFNAMSDDERIAQLMVVALAPGNDDVSRAAAKRAVEHHVGGVIYSESDLATMGAYNNYAQSLSRVPLLVTMDFEWGLSMRLSDAPKFKRNLYLGGVGDDKLLYDYGLEVARQCKLLGVHVNFAPVLDVIDREHTVVGSRAYGGDPQLVARHGIAFARGLEDGGVLAVGKHFPGHGSTIADSHKTLPLVDKSMREMQLYDLVPFKQYVNAGLGGMLIAHLNVPAIDDSGAPMSLSSKCVNGLLRERYGFEGLVFTDALDMEGAKTMEGSACVNALLAGNDVLLMPSNVEREIEAIKQAVSEGRLDRRLIDEKCKKILRYKYALGLAQGDNQCDLATISAGVNDPRSEVLARRMTAGSITVVKNDGDLLPIADVSRPVALRWPSSSLRETMLYRRAANYAPLTTSAPDGTTIVVVDNAGQVSQVKAELAAMNHVVLVVLASPEALPHFAPLMADAAVGAVVVGYDTTELTQDYVAQTIFGGNAAHGVLPVTVADLTTGIVYPAGQGVRYETTRLGYGVPLEADVDNAVLAKIDSVCNYAVKERAFPGGQVLVARHGKVIVDRCYGTIDFDDRVPVDEHTLYGLASVSKATGTLGGVMKIVDEGRVMLDDRASRYVPGLVNTDKEELTLRQFLYHETGLQPSLNMWRMMMDPNTYTGQLITSKPTETNTIKIQNGAYGHKDAKLRTDIVSTRRTPQFPIAIADGIYGGKITYDSVMARIYHSPLLLTRDYCYSCLNFSLLANVVENVTGTTLDCYVDSVVFAPLGAYHVAYRPLNKFPANQIAYTEVDTYLRRQHIHGYVHDELAAFSGGVQGNAGLFSNANDLAKLFQMWLNGGVYGGRRYLSQSTVDTFLKSKSPNSHRGLGFDKPVVGNPKASNTCNEATPSTVGHTGFTGTCYWIDPENDMIYIFLSNRVDPTRDNPAFTRIMPRSRIHSLVYHSLLK